MRVRGVMPALFSNKTDTETGAMCIRDIDSESIFYSY